MKDEIISWAIIVALVAVGHYFPVEVVVALLALHTVRESHRW